MINPKIIELFHVAPGAKVRLKQRHPGWAQTAEMKELGKDDIKGRAETILTTTISSLHLSYPDVTPETRQALEDARKQLEAE
jgi:hypothetical protein